MKSVKTIANRFWAMVMKDQCGCWFWMGQIDPKGYGRIKNKSKSQSPQYAHRVSWFLNRGSIPNDVDIHHTCGNKDCVNPAHLKTIGHVEHSILSNRIWHTTPALELA